MTSPQKTPSRLRRSFTAARDYIAGNRLQTASIAGSVLLGTTALSAPLMASTATAGLLMAGSFYLLTKSSDALIESAAEIGRKVKLSPLLIGLGLGALTSAPEMLVTASAVADGSPALGIGNVVGSNISNILLILGLTAAIAPLPRAAGNGWKLNNTAMLGVAGVFTGMLATGTLTPLMGGTLFALTAGYLAMSYKTSKRDQATEIDHSAGGETALNNGGETALPAGGKYPHNMPLAFNAAWGALGLAGLVYAADVLVNSATRFATGMGVSQALVGTLAVAVGTSLPEMVVNVKSALKGQSAIGLGNVLGSNIFNVLAVGGLVATAGTAVPEAFSPATAYGALNLGVFAGSAGLLWATLRKNGGGIKRWQGAAMVGLYAAFVAASMALDPGVAPAPSPVASPAPVIQQMPTP